MTVYVYDRHRGIMVDRDTREPMNAEPWTPATPMVMGDTPGYRSPIDGAWVDGRRARRYDLEKNNCIDANDVGPAMGKLKNRRFAEKHRMKHLLDQ